MSPDRKRAKQRIEAMYEREDRPVDDGTDRVGQMTIAFCGGDYSSDSNKEL